MHFERVGVLVNINMFDSLLHRNTKLEFEPGLATSWKALSDTTWEFKIRKGVRFHNGEIMTPEDVKYSFERVLDQTKKSPQYGNIRAIKEVKVVDPETVHIITDKPFPLLLERLVYFGIVPKKHVTGRRRSGLRGDGARRHGPVEVRRVEARPAHSPRGLRPVLARQAAVQAARLPRHPRVRHAVRGDQDGRRRHHPGGLRRHHARAQGPPATYVSSTPILRVHYVELDMRSAPFDKKAARQAANYAIDKQTIMQKLMAGLATQVATVGAAARLRLRSRDQAVSLRSEEGQGVAHPGGLSERRRHHAAQLRALRTGRSSRPSARC